VWIACPLGLLAFISGLIALIAAFAVFGGDLTSTIQNKVCGDALGGANFIKAQYGPSVDNTMCSTTCKCASDTTAAVKAQFTGSPLRTGGATSFDWSGTYTTYEQCFNAISAAQGSAAGATTGAKDFFLNGGFQFLKSFEKQYDCAGLCYTPLFYLTKPLSVGPPTTSCDAAFIASVAGNTGVGAIALVTGFILLSVMVGSIPLCSGYASDGGAMGGA
jgi:hypothetical protein